MTHTWADGFGAWHARVSRHAVAPLLVARKAIKAELEERYAPATLDPDVWRKLERVESLDDEDTIVFRERDPNPDPL